jgi:hypothetical protein
MEEYLPKTLLASCHRDSKINAFETEDDTKRARRKSNLLEISPYKNLKSDFCKEKFLEGWICDGLPRQIC